MDVVVVLLAFVLLMLVVAPFRLYMENGRLLSVALRLQQRRVQRGALRLVQRIDGAWRDRQVTLEVPSTGRLLLRVAAPRSLGPLTIRRQGLTTLLRAALDRQTQLVSRHYALSGDPAASARLIDATERVRKLDWRIRVVLESLDDLGGDSIHLTDGALEVEVRRVETEGVMAILEYLCVLAEGLEDLAVLNGVIRERARADRRCPFCHDGLSEEVRTCAACDTSHHAACWDENGGCSVFACPGGPDARQPRDRARERP